MANVVQGTSNGDYDLARGLRFYDTSGDLPQRSRDLWQLISGDAAEMWTRKMIEHHRGAIAMSRVAVRDARDAETKRMAQMTITKQEKDIAELQAWLSKHGKRPQ